MMTRAVPIEPTVWAAPRPKPQPPKLTRRGYQRLTLERRLAAIDKWVQENPRPPEPPPAPPPPPPEPPVFSPAETISPREVMDRCLAVLGVSFMALGGLGRHPDVVHAREVVSVILRAHRFCGKAMSYPEIAKMMGKSSHTTIITVINRWATEWRHPVERMQAIAIQIGLFDGIACRIEEIHRYANQRYDAVTEKRDQEERRRLSGGQ